MKLGFKSNFGIGIRLSKATKVGDRERAIHYFSLLLQLNNRCCTAKGNFRLENEHSDKQGVFIKIKFDL